MLRPNDPETHGHAPEEPVAERYREFGVQSFGAKLDVTNEDERVAVIERTVNTLGGLDFLTNNAGGGGPNPF